MKKLVAIILTGALVFGLAGCGNTNSAVNEVESSVEIEESTVAAAESVPESTQEAEEKKATKVIVDHAGVEVEIPTEINRIVVGNTLPLASVLTVYLGGAEKIVGIHPSSMGAAQSSLLSELYPEILDAKTDFINGTEINIEELLNLEPDIVIGVGAEQAQTLRDAGIPAVTVSVSAWDYNVVETYTQWINLFDEIFGESKLSDQISAYSEQAYADIQEKVSGIAEEDKKKVMILFNYSEETMTTSGGKFFGQFWCDASGAINVGHETQELGTLTIDMEQVYEWNPDIIIITNFTNAVPEDLYTNAIGGDDWSTVKAVQEKQVYKMPLGLYRSFTPGADTPVTLQWFAKTVYPEIFEDVDIKQVAKDYFHDYFKIDLTEEQVESLFTPSKESANSVTK